MSKFGSWFATIVAGCALSAAVASAEGGKVSKGQALFVKHRCAACHSVKAVGVEKKVFEGDEEAAEAAKSKSKPPDLSGVGLEHNAAWFARWLQKKEMKDGKPHKKKFRGTEAELKTLSEWIATLKMDETGKPKKGADKAAAAEAPAEKAPAAETPAATQAPAEGGK